MFGSRVRELRIGLNIDQVRLAKDLKVSKQTVSNWENDNVYPSVDMLIKLSNYFSVSTDYLLDLDNRRYIEVTGLTEEQIGRIQKIIKDIQHR
ncbi:MAG: XRE family transcriptional regulator [Clostridiales bacterium]|nr:MAG: XRE family transcriptional regulator [Clostridiales bacterium]